jgi:hypothetical protein
MENAVRRPKIKPQKTLDLSKIRGVSGSTRVA